MPKAKREEAGSLSKIERQKMYRLYREGCAASGSVRNLVKPFNPPVPTLKQFLHWKPSFTKFTLATRKFRGMKSFARVRMKLGVWTWHTLTN